MFAFRVTLAISIAAAAAGMAVCILHTVGVQWGRVTGWSY